MVCGCSPRPAPSLCQVFAAAERCGEKPGEPHQGMGAEVGFPSVSPGVTPGVQWVQPLALSLSRFLLAVSICKSGQGKEGHPDLLFCPVMFLRFTGREVSIPTIGERFVIQIGMS